MFISMRSVEDGCVTLKQLKYLLGVVDNGLNITAAAERLYDSMACLLAA